MEYYHNTYKSELIKEPVSKLIWRLEHNAGMPQIYVISLASNCVDLFDIVHSTLYMQENYKKDATMIIGFAKGYEDAQYLVQFIIEDILSKTNDPARIRSYFEQQQVTKVEETC